MSDIAIRVQNLSKQYRIGEAQAQYKTLRETLVSTAKRLLPSNFKASTRVPETTIWALNDVSFEIQRGEVVGIIGRNGAGKSTLLKVLAHITNPTKGRVEIHGRVGSLLEVGTGFHNELTGRENIYLNGAILGMKKAEIERKFDEIVDFAEIEKFLDTPVKHYSSGMYMRLAFAVAAHLEPEILLVDEVLAVGDAQFQQKCLGKMGEVANEGRTVLFVSHNMAAVRKLCQRAICLHEGQILVDGETNPTIDTYLGRDKANLFAEFLPNPSSIINLNRIEICNPSGNIINGAVETADGFIIKMTYDVNQVIQGIHIFLRINLIEGDTLLSTGDADTFPERLGIRKPGRYRCTVNITSHLLGPGLYTISWSAGIPFQTNYDGKTNALTFWVKDDRSSRSDFIHFKRPGFLGLDFDWKYEVEPFID
jgi:lipopolysaccharide transport system ATP-binding protein